MPPLAARLLKTDLVMMLSESLGQEKANETVAAAAQQLQLSGRDFDREETLAILELMASSPGLVGIVARFAKARAILSFMPSDEPASSRRT